MDQKQIREIIKQLELGKPLSAICKSKNMPDVSTVYKWCRTDDEIQKKVMDARQMGVWTLLDKIAEDMDVPKTPQEVHWMRERYNHIRWLASRLLSTTFGDKQKIEQKTDTTLTISWGRPDEKKDMLPVKEIVDQVSTENFKRIPNSNELVK